MVSWRAWVLRTGGCCGTWTGKTCSGENGDRSDEALPHRILIVDDDPHIREVIRFALKKAGMNVTEARDGKEALSALPGPARPRRARYRHAGDRRARGLPRDPQDLRRADPVPLRARRRDRPRARPRDRRRRLRHQALQPARAGGAGQRHPAPRLARGRTKHPGRAGARRAVGRSGAACRRVRRHAASAHRHRVRDPARVPGAADLGVQPRADHGAPISSASRSPTAPSTATSATSAPSSRRGLREHHRDHARRRLQARACEKVA